MKSLFEDLWENYQVEKSEELKESLKNIHHEITKKTVDFEKTLTKEQQKSFDNLKETVSVFQCISDKECFFDGLRFAVSFIFEGLI